MFGILLIHKEAGCTSHDVVDAVRRKMGTRRVGHAGTLDPLATGLLVVAVGPATRFLQYLPLEPKEYVAEISFGKATTTYDAEGEVTQEEAIPEDLEDRIQNALPQFKGLISQLPPMFSAIKVGGKPLYQMARQGKDVQREPRNVHIETFDLQMVDLTTARARIVCSGGTYIRSLAHDLGQAIGCGAFLRSLHRNQVGRFGVDQSLKLDGVTSESVLPLKEALKPMPMHQLSDAEVHQIREGRQIGTPEEISASSVALLDANGDVFSIARVQGHLLQPECVIPIEAFHAA